VKQAQIFTIKNVKRKYIFSVYISNFERYIGIKCDQTFWFYFISAFFFVDVFGHLIGNKLSVLPLSL